MDKIEIKHNDHGLDDAHVMLVHQVVASQPRPGFFMAVKRLPAGASNLQCALHGPSVGDDPVAEEEVTYTVRNGRLGPSRLVDRPTRPCRNLVVIGVAGENPVVFTAYGTQADEVSPREWWDTGMKPHEAIEAARFWSVHALSSED